MDKYNKCELVIDHAWQLPGLPGIQSPQSGLEYPAATMCTRPSLKPKDSQTENFLQAGSSQWMPPEICFHWVVTYTDAIHRHYG